MSFFTRPHTGKQKNNAICVFLFGATSEQHFEKLHAGLFLGNLKQLREALK